jgi:hypothetical protein
VPALYLGKAVSSDDRETFTSRARYTGILARERRCDTDGSLPVSRRSGNLAVSQTGQRDSCIGTDATLTGNLLGALGNT